MVPGGAVAARSDIEPTAIGESDGLEIDLSIRGRSHQLEPAERAAICPTIQRSESKRSTHPPECTAFRHSWLNSGRLEGMLLPVYNDAESERERMVNGYGHRFTWQNYCGHRWGVFPLDTEAVYAPGGSNSRKRKRNGCEDPLLQNHQGAPRHNENSGMVGFLPTRLQRVNSNRKVHMCHQLALQRFPQWCFMGPPYQRSALGSVKCDRPAKGRKVDEQGTAILKEANNCLHSIARRCIAISAELDIFTAPCGLCGSADYVAGAKFTPRTMLICDQCEREFHVGCLRQYKGMALQELPADDWFCSRKCHRVHGALMDAAHAGEVQFRGESFMVIRGKSRNRMNTPILHRIRQILEECFDPIVCRISGISLLPLLVQGEQVEEWDFSGTYCLALRGKERNWVSALVFRVFGEEVAEVPLVATVPDARGRGYGGKMMSYLENLLRCAGVKRLLLPSAESTVPLWTSPRFGFLPVKKDPTLRWGKLFAFPGTVWCRKDLADV